MMLVKNVCPCSEYKGISILLNFKKAPHSSWNDLYHNRTLAAIGRGGGNQELSKVCLENCCSYAIMIKTVYLYWSTLEAQL